jgi:uncharacterized SAM-binding protein YcdF (DUF218 family)
MPIEATDWLRQAVKTLVLPPGGPLLLIFLGLWLARRHAAGRWIATAGALSLWVLSLPLVAAWLAATLSPTQPVDLAEAGKAQAIVILGGGVRREAAEYGGDTLGRLTLERTRYGARLARQTELPVLVTGGSVKGDTRPEAHLMRESLEGEFGVPVKWIEDRSRNTHENALRSAEVLRAAGVQRVLVVVHGFDVPRAKAEFAATGLEVIVAPTQIPRLEGLVVGDFLPSVSALETSYWALYEHLALLAR